MSKFIYAVSRFVADERAVTSLEYSIIAVVIVIATVATLGLIGANLGALFESSKYFVP